MKQSEIKYVKDHGYRVITHDDKSATIYVLVGNDHEGYSEYPFHVRDLDQARQVMGY